MSLSYSISLPIYFRGCASFFDFVMKYNLWLVTLMKYEKASKDFYLVSHHIHDL